jgi:signal peptidase I
MFLVLDNTYGKTTFVEPYKDKKRNALIITSSIVMMTIITMLISCQFTYGILVVGSKSMTGAIDKGDAILYKSYKDEEIKNGEIIVFDYDDIKLVHRVVDIVNVNGELRYYTKGDVNKDNDPGYRTKENIIGIEKLKIKYIGIPTLWLHELFNNN